jgi:hypothetical protein
MPIGWMAKRRAAKKEVVVLNKYLLKNRKIRIHEIQCNRILPR